MNWLLDAYRWKDQIALWLKTPRGDERILVPYEAWVRVRDTEASRCATRFMQRREEIVKTTYGSEKTLAIRAPKLEDYERLVRELEQLLRFRVPLFDADIAPEQRYLYENDLHPGCAVEIENGAPRRIATSERPLLRVAQLRIVMENGSIKALTLDGQLFVGEEFLARFALAFTSIDPDVVSLERAFKFIPLLESALLKEGVSCPFHRFDATPLKYRGGKTFFSYGQVRYQDYGVRLRGRILVDTTTTIGGSMNVEHMLELAELSGARLQTIASRSHGAVFQASLMRELVRTGMAVPYKEKPIEKPMSMKELLASDRTGQILDPAIGLHTNVAEIDFLSMYPFLIHNHNISAETILQAQLGSRVETVPGTPVRISQDTLGVFSHSAIWSFQRYASSSQFIFQSRYARFVSFEHTEQ